MERRALTLVLATWMVAGCPKEEPVACTEFEEIFVWADGDGDGFGSDEPVGYVCAAGDNQATNNADCDDEEPTVHPGAEELCDLLDNDCNNRVDESQPKTPWYEDSDGDGYGSNRDWETACAAPGPTWLAVSGDCRDEDPEVNPAAREFCNGIDDDCDGRTDDEDGGVDPTTFTRWYRDLDGDGYGDTLGFVDQCEGPPGTILNGEDCNDARPAINPTNQEVCNRIDDDCDGLTDDFDPSIDPAGQTLFYSDADGDGYGDPASQTLACESVAGFGVDNDLDCDDTNEDANLSQNWYEDVDQDGFGAGAPVLFQCLDPGDGLVPEAVGVDCDDFDPFENPAVPEVCDDTVDQNCNLAVDCDDSDCLGTPGCLAICADFDIPSAVPSQTNGDTLTSGDDTVPSCNVGSTANDVAIQWIPPATAMYTIDLAGSSYDTMLYVYDGCGGPELACNDDFIGLQSQVQVQGTAGVPLIIVVDGFGASNGTYVLNIQ